MIAEVVLRFPGPLRTRPSVTGGRDHLSCRLGLPKAGATTITLNWKFTDTRQEYMVGVENGALNYTSGVQAKEADATITLSRATLNQVLLGKGTLDDMIKNGQIKVVGNRDKLDELLSLLDKFEFWFNIVTPVESKS